MDKKAMLNGLVTLINWFNQFTSSALQYICGPLVDFVLKASGEGGEKWVEDFKRFLRGELVIKESDLLSRVTTVGVSGAARFVAADHLSSANVGWTGDNFNRLFRNNVEENVEEATLAVSRLAKDSLDVPILAELGDRAETALSYLFALLEKQSKGEAGVLLVNGAANIFYIRGTDNALWALRAYWSSGDGYWDVEAFSVERPYRWDVSCQVFSRD